MSISEVLHEAGLRRTRTRESVLHLLSEAGRPLSHQEISNHPGAEGLDRVTLYRTLATLQKVGLVHTVQGMDGAWRYCFHGDDHASCPGNHPHFLCLQCGEMRCLIGQSIPWISVLEGARVKGKQLVVHGSCPGCAAAGRSTGRDRGDKTMFSGEARAGTGP